jgi:hypothetical protein
MLPVCRSGATTEVQLFSETNETLLEVAEPKEIMLN